MIGATAVIIESAQAALTEIGDVVVVTPARFRPKGPHDPLPLGPVGADPRPKALVRENVRHLVWDGSIEKVRTAPTEQLEVVADQIVAARADSDLPSGSAAQIKAQLDTDTPSGLALLLERRPK